MQRLQRTQRLYQFLQSILLSISILISSSVSAGGFLPDLNDAQPWHLLVTPYVWIVGMHGSVTVKGTVADIDFSPIDVIKSFGDVDFIGQLHVEARRGKWTFLFDPTYFKVTKSAAVGILGASVTPQLFLLDYGVFYTINKFLLSTSGYSTILQGFVGGRYMHMKATINPQNFPSVSGSEGFGGIILGGRLISQINPRLFAQLRADIGGFSLGNLKSTWSTVFLFDYIPSKSVAISFGLRVLGVDYAKGQGANRFALNSRFYGPVFGIGFLV